MGKDFFNKLNILFVEDDDVIREKTFETLSPIFNKLFMAKDGFEALDLYKEHKDHLDVIVSDIEMPKMNGIELLSNVRQYDSKLPFIFTTGYTNHEYLVNSLKLGADDYFVKPINLKELLRKIVMLINDRNIQSSIPKEQNLLTEYLDTINKVAFVYIFNEDKKITYINDFYKQISKFDDHEVVNQDFDFLYHSDISKKLIEDKWKHLVLGNKWNGTLKFKTKDKTDVFSNCTIVPICENKEKKYISINFITTQEENSRREYKKKVLYNYQETKRIYQKAQAKIDELVAQIEKFQDVDKKEHEINQLKSDNNKYLTNIDELEEKLKIIRIKQEKFTEEVNKTVKIISESTIEMKNFARKSDMKIIQLKSEIKVREQYIEKIKKELDIKKQKVSDLKEVLDHRNEQFFELLGIKK